MENAQKCPSKLTSAMYESMLGSSGEAALRSSLLAACSYRLLTCLFTYEGARKCFGNMTGLLAILFTIRPSNIPTSFMACVGTFISCIQ